MGLLSSLAGLFKRPRGGLVSSTLNEETGEMETTQYTAFFDVGDYLSGQDLGVQIVIEMAKKEVPGWYDLKVSMGALGPDDSYAPGVVTLYFYNLTQLGESLKLIRASCDNVTINKDEVCLDIDGEFRTRLDAGMFPAFTYAKAFEISLLVEFAGEAIEKKFTVPRLSCQEMDTQFGQNGKPDYPWFVGQ